MRPRLLQILSVVAILIVVGMLVLVPSERRIKPLTKYVDPFIGTTGPGQVSLSASVPFGLVQCGPESGPVSGNTDDADRPVFGFTHFNSGLLYSDIRLMPFTNSHAAGLSSLRNNERAQPGYYGVDLSDADVQVDITATPHTALYRCTFPQGRPASIRIETVHSRKKRTNLQLRDEFRVVSSNSAQGSIRFADSRGDTGTVYYYLEFNIKPESVHVGKNLSDSRCADSGYSVSSRARFGFGLLSTPLLCKIGFSLENPEQAKTFVSNELDSHSFEYQMLQAHRSWNHILNRIIVRDGQHQDRILFYSALFRALRIPLPAFNACPKVKSGVPSSPVLTALCELVAPEKISADLTVDSPRILNPQIPNPDSPAFLKTDSLLHRPYTDLFNGDSIRTFRYISNIRDRFTVERDGLPTADRNGRVSAWLVWQMLGLYPLDPDEFIVQPPAFRDIRIRGEHDVFRIQTKFGDSPSPVARSAVLNDKPIQARISMKEIKKGGRLRLVY